MGKVMEWKRALSTPYKTVQCRNSWTWRNNKSSISSQGSKSSLFSTASTACGCPEFCRQTARKKKKNSTSDSGWHKHGFLGKHRHALLHCLHILQFHCIRKSLECRSFSASRISGLVPCRAWPLNQVAEQCWEKAGYPPFWWSCSCCS